MSTINFRKEGQYAVLDMEYVSAEYSGAGIHSQEIELDETDFASKVAENGMALTIVNGKVKLPTNIKDHVVVMATECEIYEEGKGRNSFCIKRGKGSQPRLIELVHGDIISTNAASYDSSEFATLENLKNDIKAGTVKAVPNVDKSGMWDITKTTTGATVIGDVLDVVTLSNGEIGVRIKF